MSLFRHARFETSFAKPQALPESDAPEIAFVGRSNAGKSSAINTLVGHNRLAFVSKTPGRTQLINFFRLPSGVALVDLPGYGYAEVPEAAKAHWEQLLSLYLQTRAQLAGLILMMDARRPLTELDRRMVEWFAPTGKPIHALLTKCDKLTRQESVLALRTTNKAFDEYRQQGYEGKLSAQLFSALKRVGLDEAHAVIESWIVPQASEEETGAAAK